MAIISIGRIKGDPDDLFRRSQSVEAVVAPKASANGGIVHVTARTDDGLMIVNLWENEEARQRTAEDPEVQAAVRQSMGDTPPPEWTAYEVLHYDTA